MNQMTENGLDPAENIQAVNNATESNSTSDNQKENCETMNANENGYDDKKLYKIDHLIEGLKDENVPWIIDKELYKEIRDIINKASNESSLIDLDANHISTLINKAVTEVSYTTNWYSGIEATYWIDIGKLANIAKLRVTGMGENWTEYARKNISTPIRSLQRYMSIAEYDGVENYSYLGIERLLILVNAMSDLEDNNSLPNFVKKYRLDNYDINQERQSSVENYKNKTQKAILKQLSISKGWDVSPETIDKCVDNNKGHFNIKQVINSINIAIEGGGSAEKYLLMISEAKGKNRKIIKDFHKVLAQLKSMAISIMSNGEFRTEVGTSKITPVIEALVKLKTNIEDDLKAQA